MKKKYYILLLTSVLCIGVKAQIKQTKTMLLFENYLATLKKISLPVKLNRDAVFEIVNNGDRLHKINNSFKRFIPTELQKINLNSTFRSLYLFPNRDSIVVTLIVQEYTDEYEMENARIYIVTYNAKGDFVDSQELAGAIVDFWEAFGEISCDYAIVSKSYQFKMGDEVDMAKYDCSEENIYEYYITNSGMIKKTKETKRNGYFECGPAGYNFIKPLNN